MSNVDLEKMEWFIEQALAEDVGEGDHTSLACIDPDSVSTAKLLVKGGGVLAGVSLARMVFDYVDSDNTFHSILEDGIKVEPGQIAFTVTCNTHALLKAERLVLNAMQRMSGIATISKQFVEAVEEYNVTILDTRKTTPLVRFLEKWAVEIGGASNYRSGLYDRIMIKDNHVDACGGIIPAINEVKAYLRRNNFALPITVEVRTLEDVQKVLSLGGIDRIMLDNFDIPKMKEAVKMIGNRVETEASGGINMSTVEAVAKTGVQFISVGALTHSFKSVDLSLKIQK